MRLSTEADCALEQDDNHLYWRQVGTIFAGIQGSDGVAQQIFGRVMVPARAPRAVNQDIESHNPSNRGIWHPSNGVPLGHQPTNLAKSPMRANVPTTVENSDQSKPFAAIEIELNTTGINLINEYHLIQCIPIQAEDTLGLFSAIFCLSREISAYEFFVANRDCFFADLYSELLNLEIDHNVKEKFMLFMTETNLIVYQFVEHMSKYLQACAVRIASDTLAHITVKMANETGYAAEKVLGLLPGLHESHTPVPYDSAMTVKIGEILDEHCTKFVATITDVKGRVNNYLEKNVHIRDHSKSAWVDTAFKRLVTIQPQILEPVERYGLFQYLLWPQIKAMSHNMLKQDLKLPYVKANEIMYSYVTHIWRT